MAGITPVGQPVPDPTAAVDIAVSGASGANLASLLSEGDVVSATIIGSNGVGQDVIEILGQKIIAQLPPTYVPGEQILLQVVRADGNNIVTRNISDAAAAAAVADGTASAVPPERGIPPPVVPGNQAGPPAAPPPPGLPPTPAAPSNAVFVAASVTPSRVIVEEAPAPPLVASGAPAPPAPANPSIASASPASASPATASPATAPPATAPPASASPAGARPANAPLPGAPPATVPGAGNVYRPPSGTGAPNLEKAPLQSVELRIAASRAETAARTNPPAAPPTATAVPTARPAGAPPGPTAPPGPAAPPPPSTQTIINRITIAHRDLGATAPKAAPSSPLAPGSASFAKPPSAPLAPEQAAPASPQAAAAAPRSERSPLAFGTPPATQLRPNPAPRLEPTSSAPLLSPSELVSAARTATAASATTAAAPGSPATPAAVPSLPPERILLEHLHVPQTAITRAAATLVAKDSVAVPQALLALDAALATAGDDPRVLAARTIATFVSNLDPEKPTLATQLQSYVDHVATGSEEKLATMLGAQSAGTAEKAALASAPAAANAEQLLLPIPGIADAHAAERDAALDHNLKNLLLSLAASPPAEAGATTASAIQNALTQITASQLQTLQSMQVNPGAITFAIPLPWPGGGQNAELHVWRDAPQKSGALTSDNFHIAFVLNTANLGTVAVDLQSVGRGVKVGVKTEESGAAGTFRSALGALGERLETLKYRVVKLDAEVAARGAVRAEARAAMAPEIAPAEEDPSVTVDLKI